MKKKSTCVTVMLSALLLSGSLPAADTANATKSKETPERRQKMADMHQKMADCLRSDKPMSECKQEMMKGCHEMMDKGGCPMMGDMQGHMKGGMMGKGMMSGKSGESSGTGHEGPSGE